MHRLVKPTTFTETHVRSSKLNPLHEGPSLDAHIQYTFLAIRYLLLVLKRWQYTAPVWRGGEVSSSARYANRYDFSAHICNCVQQDASPLGGDSLQSLTRNKLVFIFYS